MSRDLILGIETSCDDTSVALVTHSGEVIAEATADQTDIHRAWGGVYPELASRAHIAAILPVLERVLTAVGYDVIAQAGATPKDIRAIGVTRGPGLIGSLLVGINTAKALGMGWGCPVVGVNHLRGHLRSADLHLPTESFPPPVETPAIALLVSGGHTLLAHLQSPDEVELLGTTRDDSVGEAYDKVGRMLGLGYPAGAEMDRLACTGTASIKMPRPMIQSGFEFSFSGLKTAAARVAQRTDAPSHADIAASFVEACCDVLMTKCRRALETYPVKSLILVGGVSASPQIRAAAKHMCENLGILPRLAPLRWATDNGAMIALAAWDQLSTNPAPPNPDPSLSLNVR